MKNRFSTLEKTSDRYAIYKKSGNSCIEKSSLFLCTIRSIKCMHRGVECSRRASIRFLFDKIRRIEAFEPFKGKIHPLRKNIFSKQQFFYRVLGSRTPREWEPSKGKAGVRFPAFQSSQMHRRGKNDATVRGWKKWG